MKTKKEKKDKKSKPVAEVKKPQQPKQEPVEEIKQIVIPEMLTIKELADKMKIGSVRDRKETVHAGQDRDGKSGNRL